MKPLPYFLLFLSLFPVPHPTFFSEVLFKLARWLHSDRFHIQYFYNTHELSNDRTFLFFVVSNTTSCGFPVAAKAMTALSIPFSLRCSIASPYAPTPGKISLSYWLSLEGSLSSVASAPTLAKALMTEARFPYCNRRFLSRYCSFDSL